jgi:uncharacterized protein
MEIQLDTITADPSELDLSASAEELDLQLDLAAVQGPVSLRLTAWRIEDEVFLNGTVAYSIQYTCARCLGEFLSDCALPLHLVLQLVADEAVAETDDEDDEFVAVSASRTEYILDQHLRDLIALEVPMKPVCREDCRGLCPICGANKNETTCECQQDRQDPRWDALRKLRNS